jgi:undecaprenyl-diphosphatase
VLLGVIEGLTEFLPVGSPVHLRIFEALARVSLSGGCWKMFSIVIQLGAILCLRVYFRAPIAEFAARLPCVGRERPRRDEPLVLVVVASGCTAVPSLLLIKVIGENLESTPVMGVTLIAGRVARWAVDALYAHDKLPRRGERIEGMHLGPAVWVGACQIFSAVFPGTARPGWSRSSRPMRPYP